MNLKTFLFDKATFKSDIKRFWWITAIFMLLLALFVLPRAVYSVDDGMIQNVTDDGLFALVFGFFLPGMIFSYLHKGNAVSFVHGLPTKRTTVFLSHIFAGLALLYVPIIISGIVIGAEGMYYQGHIHYALKYMYTCGIYSTLAFMITSFAMLISGNTVAGYLFSFGFIILPGFIIELLDGLFRYNLFGFVGYDRVIMRFIYLTFMEDVCSLKSLWYIALIIVLFGLCIWLYGLRRLENYDEIVAFNPLKTVFMYTVAICFGYLGYMLFYSVTDINALFLGVLPLGFAALIAAFMLNKKSFTIKGAVKHIVIFTVIAAAVKLVIAYDLTGYERRIPDLSEVESIEPYGEDTEETYNQFYAYGRVTPNYLDAVPIDASIKDEKTMEDIINIHKNILERGRTGFKNNEADEDNVMYSYIKVVYNLKNGRHMKRMYRICDEDYADCIAPYYENPQYKLAHYPLSDNRKRDIKYAVYNNPILQNEVQLVNIDGEKLLEALKKDISGLSYMGAIKGARNGYDSSESLIVEYTEDVQYNGRTYTFKRADDFTLNREYKNTLALINEEMQKYKDRYIDLNDVRGVYMTFDAYYDSEADETKYKSTANITDKAEVSAIYDALGTNSQYIDENSDNTDFHDIRIVFTRNGDEQYAQYTAYLAKPYNEIPEVIRKYIKETDGNAAGKEEMRLSPHTIER